MRKKWVTCQMKSSRRASFGSSRSMEQIRSISASTVLDRSVRRYRRTTEIASSTSWFVRRWSVETVYTLPEVHHRISGGARGASATPARPACSAIVRAPLSSMRIGTCRARQVAAQSGSSGGPRAVRFPVGGTHSTADRRSRRRAHCAPSAFLAVAANGIRQCPAASRVGWRPDGFGLWTRVPRERPLSTENCHEALRPGAIL